MASPARVTPREPSSLRVLTLTTLQQAGLTSIRFGLPILAPYWREAFHLSLAQVGVLLGAFDLGALLLFIPIGLLTDRWGGAAVLGAGALFTAAMTAVTTRAEGYWPLALLLAIAGLGYGSGQTAGTQAVAAAFGAGKRGIAMGVRQSGLPLGGLLAAILLPALAGASGWRTAIGGAAALCAIPGELCWVGLREQRGRRGVVHAGGPEPRAISDRLREVLHDPGIRRTTAVAMLLVLVQFCYQGYLALYMVDRFGWSKRGAAALLIAVHFGGVLGRLAWGMLSDRHFGGRRVPAMTWCVGAGVLLPLTLVAVGRSPSTPAVVAVALAGGMLLLGWNGLYSTLIIESVSPHRAATAMGVSMTLLYTTTMVAPPLFGWLIDHTSYAVGWVALAAVMVWALAATARIPEPGLRPRGVSGAPHRV